MSRPEKGLRAFPAYRENPYLSNLVIPSREKTVAVARKRLPLFDEDGAGSMAFVGVKERVDKEKFVKIFKSHIQALFGLSTQGLKIFGYMMYATRISEDRIVFDQQECKAFTGYKSKNSINLGLAELLDKGFIARTPHANLYFLNPSIFFNGDRMIVVKDYVKKGSAADRAYLAELEAQTGLNAKPAF